MDFWLAARVWNLTQVCYKWSPVRTLRQNLWEVLSPGRAFQRAVKKSLRYGNLRLRREIFSWSLLLFRCLLNPGTQSSWSFGRRRWKTFHCGRGPSLDMSSMYPDRTGQIWLGIPTMYSVLCTDKGRPLETGSLWFTNLLLAAVNVVFEEELASTTILISILDPVYTTREEFENRGFTLKTHQMFSVRITPATSRIER